MKGFNLEPQDVPRISTAHRSIRTALPHPESLPILAGLADTEARSMHGQLPVVWDRAEGFQVHDPWGNTWIDFSSTIFVANAGHGNARIVAAIQRVLDKPLLHTYTFANTERTAYLRYLIDNTPAQFERAFLLSAGTEAVECALKLMRMHAQSLGKRRGGVIALQGNWHGRTLGAQFLAGNEAQKTWIGYRDPDIHHIPFPYEWDADAAADPEGFFQRGIERLLAEKELDPDQDLAGFMLETFQGWAAAFYPPAFVQEVERFARRHGMLLAFDEMQAGFGRTGKLFGYMHYGVEPDLLCVGKGASSSLPVSAVLGRESVLNLPAKGSMSSTHSANPMCCAAAHANLEALLEDGLIDNAAELGAHMQARLADLSRRHGLRLQGRGMVAAVIAPEEGGGKRCDAVSELAMQRGLLVVHTGRESIKIAPPLSITRAALDEGLDVLETCFEDCP
ncbi:MAG: aspartate aminotransferase family protein [Rhodothermales bacterium]|nr:aspartate aminotransferase family protein [Rhodothermales bacterium]